MKLISMVFIFLTGKDLINEKNSKYISYDELLPKHESINFHYNSYNSYSSNRERGEIFLSH